MRRVIETIEVDENMVRSRSIQKYDLDEDGKLRIIQSLDIITEELPYELNEELKLLRTNLQFLGTDKRVIAMTSAFSGEGKSTIWFDLAVSLTELGKSVLFIDCDLRKSQMLERVNGFEPSRGLSHFLSGQCYLEDCLFSTNVENMYMIFSGSIPPNPSELLSTQAMKDLIEIARKNFDYVLLDCPPIGMVVDAAVIGQECDGSMIIIESGEVKYRLAQEVVSKMKATGKPVLGVVLNKVDRHKSGKYYGRYYGRYYGKKYKGYY